MGGAIAGEKVGGLRLRSEGGARNIVVFALRQIFFGRKLSTGQNFPKGPVHTRTHTRVNIFPSAHRHRNESLIVSLMSTYDRERGRSDPVRLPSCGGWSSQTSRSLRWVAPAARQVRPQANPERSTCRPRGHDRRGCKQRNMQLLHFAEGTAMGAVRSDRFR